MANLETGNDNVAKTLHDKETAYRTALHSADMGQVTDTAARALQQERQTDLLGEITRVNSNPTPGYAQRVFEDTKRLDEASGYYPQLELHDGRLALKSAYDIQNDDGEAGVRKAFDLPLTASKMDVALADDHTVQETNRIEHPEWGNLSDGREALRFAQWTKGTVSDAVPKVLREELGLKPSATEGQVWQRLLNDLQPDLKSDLGLPNQVDEAYADRYLSSANGREKLASYMKLAPNLTDLQLQNFLLHVTCRQSTEVSHG